MHLQRLINMLKSDTARTVEPFWHQHVDTSQTSPSKWEILSPPYLPLVITAGRLTLTVCAWHLTFSTPTRTVLWVGKHSLTCNLSSSPVVGQVCPVWLWWERDGCWPCWPCAWCWLWVEWGERCCWGWWGWCGDWPWLCCWWWWLPLLPAPGECW